MGRIGGFCFRPTFAWPGGSKRRDLIEPAAPPPDFAAFAERIIVRTRAP
jgi:hypothetical protein